MVNILEVKDIQKSFTINNISLPVLKSINLQVVKGEILVIIGPSGAGKSTLLHILGFLDESTKGEVSFQGQWLSKTPARKKVKIRGEKIGFVFQFYNLLPDFSVLENVYMPALIAGGKFRASKRLKQKSREILDWVGLSHRLGHRPNELSGGERQRVAVARAIINDPELLLADEPTGNLDSEAADRIWALLTKLNKEKGQTVVIVTHNEELAQKADRVVRLKDGVIVDY